VRKKKRAKIKKFQKKREKKRFVLPEETKNGIFGILMILIAILVSLSFFEKAGIAGYYFMKTARSLIGETVFLIPLIFILGGFVFLISQNKFSFLKKEREIFWLVIFAVLVIILGISGILGSFNQGKMRGGYCGYILTWPFLKYFGFWATLFIFIALIAIGGFVFWQFLRQTPFFSKEKKPDLSREQEVKAKKPSLIKKIFAPKFKVKEITDSGVGETFDRTQFLKEKEAVSLKGEKKGEIVSRNFSYQPPPFELLEKEKEIPTTGDTRMNSAIIKKTLQNFGIDVVMSEINIGPTVTQYTLKPAEGVKLSKITNLANDLALALASHPIRIEAPIPGRSLVGIEVPNKTRAKVRLRDLIENPNFQKNTSSLTFALGRDVSGFPVYADLAKMPHLLVAGSTGTGKTIFLNSLILSLLYQPTTESKSAGPEFLRLILVDPKRVEFPVYQNLPHLLCPVIYTASQTVNVLRWLTGEMERRFDVLSEKKSRDIRGFNEKALKNGKNPLPFIVVIIDELADLMAARGREIEAGIVRLAQMARAVGIHLVVATQRPSVEVITGLIKANITSRITFQVASQVDSRTVIDTSGAEKLLGAGDMLFISAQVIKPKRIQAPYVSEKEVKKVIDYIVSKAEERGEGPEMDIGLLEEINKEGEGLASSGSWKEDEDPLYEEAKRTVIEMGRASASLLQRRLRVGYARAARLIDMLEERGVVGPGEGAKPREVYGETEQREEERTDNSEEENGWKKV